MSEVSISQQVLVSLRQIIRALDLRSRQLEKSVGLTVPQLIVLKEIAEAGEAPIGQIAKRVSVSQATVTTVADRLEHRGAISRKRAESDRRKVYVQLTAYGEELLAKSPTILQEEFLEEFDKLVDWEQTQILATLQRVAAMMNAQGLPATPLLTVDSFTDPPIEASESRED